MTEIQTYTERAGLATAQDVAVQRLSEWAQSADAAYGVATRLVESSFVPQGFRGKPVEATAAILAGIEVGLSPMAALRSFDVIQGQAAPRAITLRAIVQSHGHEMILVESTATRCRMKGRRKGSDEWQGVTWTIDRARDLGLVSKDNWKKQPGAMLVARATSELARLIASDAILGIGYSAEEVADGGSFEQHVEVDTTAPVAPEGTRRMSRKPRPEPEQHADESPEPEPTPDAITSAQQKKMGALMREAGITDRDLALAFVADVIGREVGSRNELTKVEAGRVIDALEADAARANEPVDAEIVADEPLIGGDQ